MAAHDSGITAANERDLFSLRSVREALDGVVACDLQADPDSALGRQFGLRDEPLMIVLDPATNHVLTIQKGKMDALQFRTHIAPPLKKGAGEPTGAAGGE